MKKNISYIIYLLVTCIGILLLCEAFAKYILIGKRNNLIKNSRFINLKEYNPNSTFDIQPLKDNIPFPFSYLKIKTKIKTDSNGFIVTDKNTIQPDIKLFFLGGSTTECLYNNEYKRFPELTARILEKELKLKINSYNCGLGGINSLHSLNILLNKVIPNKPDYVFFMHNINDLVTLDYFGTYWIENKPRANINNFDYMQQDVIDNKSSLIRLFPNMTKLLFYNIQKDKISTDEFKGVRKNAIRNEFDTTEKINLFKKNVQTFINICNAQKATPILITQANAYNILGFKWFEKNRTIELNELGDHKKEYFTIFIRMLDKFNNVIKETAIENKCILIDLNAKLNDIAYFRDEVHLNDLGSEKAALEISSTMQTFIHIKKYNDTIR